mgnify:FL=1
MAGTLYETVLELVSKLDVYAAALSAAKAGAGAAAGFFLKKLGGMFVKGESNKCVVHKCRRPSYKNGLCMQCYSTACSRVERGETDWEALAALGLCKMDKSPFDDAYTRAMEDH